MARIRSIKPSFFSDAKMNDLSLEAQFLYVGLWVFADDDGLLWDDPDQIRMDVFPGRPHVRVEPLVAELLLCGRVVSLETTIGRHALWVKNLGVHQKIDHPSVSVIAPFLVSPPESTRLLGLEGKGRERKGKTSSSPAAQDDRWEKFWNLYPPRKGKKLDKAKAGHEFGKLNEEDRSRAMTGVAHYRSACDSGVMAKDAFRWLRDHCFEDWQEPATVVPHRNGTASEPAPSEGAGRRRGWNVSSETYEEYMSRGY